MADSMLGWELLFRASKSDIRKKEDVLLILIHYSLLKSEFKCFGKSENWSAEETGSELLPADWNCDKEYVIRYKRNEDKFLLMSNHSDVNVIVFNLTVSEKLQVSNLICNYNDTVTSLEGDISSMVPTFKSLLDEIRERLISPLITSEKNHVETQTTTYENKNYAALPVREPIHVPTYIFPNNSDPYYPSIGRRDLDPFGVGGSAGNLFDPFTENRNRVRIGPGIPEPLPRGAVPPRARFDPFGPPDFDPTTRRRYPPDLDDMFS